MRPLNYTQHTDKCLQTCNPTNLRIENGTKVEKLVSKYKPVLEIKPGLLPWWMNIISTELSAPYLHKMWGRGRNFYLFQQFPVLLTPFVGGPLVLRLFLHQLFLQIPDQCLQSPHVFGSRSTGCASNFTPVCSKLFLNLSLLIFKSVYTRI